MIRCPFPGKNRVRASGGRGKSRIIDWFCEPAAKTAGAVQFFLCRRPAFGFRASWDIGMADALVNQSVDAKKRRFLLTAGGVVGGVGVVAAATPFVMSMWPSARAKAAGAPVEVDISKIEPGQLITVEWRGKVCWLLNRTKPMLDSLPKLDSRLADPNSNVPQQPAYCKNEHRSIKDAMWVAIGICTHLGCSPTFRPEIAPADLGPDWLGGFFCPCHQSKFDLAGRVFKGVPAPTNLVIPPHKYASDTKIVIGVGEDGKDS
jgi:ubiquinol-cytochrome c reductase iron-sulfur subunit